MLLCFVKILVIWYSRMFVTVKLNDQYSYLFAVRSGVRQGNALSHSLFTMRMNSFVINIKSINVRCYMNHYPVSYILYADDIFQLLSSICELYMLRIVSNAAFEFFSNLMLTDLIALYSIVNLNSGYRIQNLVQKVSAGLKSNTYLGINFLSGKNASADCDVIKRKFYTASNSVFIDCHKVS